MDNLEHEVNMYCKGMNVLWLLTELDDLSNDYATGVQDSMFYHRAKIRIRKMMRDRYLEGAK